MTKTKSKKCFTLLEVVICIAILGVVATAMGVQCKSLLSTHGFYKNVDTFLTDLRKVQILALCDRIDVTIKIFKGKNGYQYQISTDEAVADLKSKVQKIEHIKKISLKKEGADTFSLHVYPSGWIEPQGELEFFLEKEPRVVVDLSKPLLLEIKKRSSYQESELS